MRDRGARLKLREAMAGRCRRFRDTHSVMLLRTVLVTVLNDSTVRIVDGRKSFCRGYLLAPTRSVLSTVSTLSC